MLRTTLVCTLHFCKVRNLRTGQTWLRYNLALSLSPLHNILNIVNLVKIFPKTTQLVTNKQTNNKQGGQQLCPICSLHCVLTKLYLNPISPLTPLSLQKQRRKKKKKKGVPQNLVVVHYILHSLEKTATFADSFIPITLFLLQSWWNSVIYTGPGHHVQYI